MIRSIEKSAKTEDEAIAQALLELGLDRDEVSVEIVERAKTGFLGIGASPAVVRISYEYNEIEAPCEQAPTIEIPLPKEVSENRAEQLPPDLDKRAERIRIFLTGLLTHMGVSAEIDISERQGGGINVDLHGNNLGVIIGRRGETLDAIQHLTNYSVNRGMSNRTHISVDAENYRSKREDSLVRLAEKMAGKAVKYRRSMALEPMNSYERHVIHTALQNFEGVGTYSTGSEPNRRVVVNYLGNQPNRTRSRD